MSYDEKSLIEQATAALSENNIDEVVRGAGVFALANLVIAGGVGAAAGGLLAGSGGTGTDVLASVAGSRVAEKAAAEAQGATIQILVAVTDAHIHLLNGDTDGRLASEFRSFDRASCDVSISKMGLSRHVHLADRDSGDAVVLTGSAGPFGVTAKGDKVVLALLAA